MTTTTAKRATECVTAYDGAVASAEMRNIRLIGSDFFVEPEGVGGDQQAWKRGYGCDVAQTHFEPKRHLVSGLIAAEAWCKLGRKRIIILKCKYIVTYDISGDSDEAAAIQFVERVGRFAVYPYFRAHFSELTGQAGIKLSPLPVLKEGPRAVPSAREADRPS